jgi:hypothetical protein
MRWVEPLAYPYLQLAEEVSTMLGEIEGWRAGYQKCPQPARCSEADRLPAGAATRAGAGRDGR